MNFNVSLSEDLAKFVESAVSGGKFSSSSEVVSEALRLMEQVENDNAVKLKILRRAYQDGLDSGDAGELDFGALKVEARKRLSAKA